MTQGKENPAKPAPHWPDRNGEPTQASEAVDAKDGEYPASEAIPRRGERQKGGLI